MTVGDGCSVAASAGAGGVSTGTDCGMETSKSLCNSFGAVWIGFIHGVSGWCQVTSRK